MKRACTRCGLVREVNESRKTSLCGDCKDIEADLAEQAAKATCPRGWASQTGYTIHVKNREIACDACLEAHRVHMAQWRRSKGMRTREQRNAEDAARCGTPSGYKKHRRNGEQACAECRAAQTAACVEPRRRWLQRQREAKESAA